MTTNCLQKKVIPMTLETRLAIEDIAVALGTLSRIFGHAIPDVSASLIVKTKNESQTLSEAASDHIDRKATLVRKNEALNNLAKMKATFMIQAAFRELSARSRNREAEDDRRATRVCKNEALNELAKAPSSSLRGCY